METISLTAPDISCEHCKMTIEREVGAISGVQACSVDIPSRQVSVTYDPTTVTRGQIVETLDEEGDPVAS